MSKKINLAFAGFRHSHIYALLELARKNERINIAGAWEEYEPDRKTAVENYKVEFNYEAYKDILEDSDVDAVAIGSYYQARGGMVIDALKAGKHIICDKPICTSMNELEEIIALQKEKKLSVFIMLDLRFDTNVQAAKKLIDDGEIGEINNISFGGQHPLLYGSRAGWYFEEGKHGGTINDIAVHGIDLVRYFTGSEIKEINGARCWNKYAKEVPHFNDSGMLMLTLESGAGVIADVSYAAPDSIAYDYPYYWEFKIWGTEGMLTFTFYTDGVSLYKNGNKEVVNYPRLAADYDYVEAFVKEINGEESGYLNTKESLRSALETLKIQYKADNR